MSAALAASMRQPEPLYREAGVGSGVVCIHRMRAPRGNGVG